MQLRAHPAAGLRGTTGIPGDKSVSHRALLLGAMAVGASRISGLLEGADVLATAAALRALGVDLERHGDGVWEVHGVGIGGLAEADRVLDLGNAGTGARLLLGLLAGHPFPTFSPATFRCARGRWPGSSRRCRRWARASRTQRQPAARRGGRHHRAPADPLSPAGRLGPGQVGGAPRRPARGRADHGDRAAAVARPHRAPAAAPRRRGRGRGPGGRHARGERAGPAGACGHRDRGPGRFLVGGISAGGRGACRRLVRAPRGVGSIRCAPGCSIAWRRWARAPHRAASGAGRRADRGSADRGRAAAGDRSAARARRAHDRRYPILRSPRRTPKAARGCAVWPSSGSRKAIGCARSRRVLAPAACQLRSGRGAGDSRSGRTSARRCCTSRRTMTIASR